MMEVRRALYSFLMVTIYVVASMLSSLSLIFCDHHHPHNHHHTECHTECCCCGDVVTISADCCDHHHPILGDNHTDYIDSSSRHGSRTLQAIALIMAPAIVDNISGEQSLYSYTLFECQEDRSVDLLDAVYISSVGLRAPPYLA